MTLCVISSMITTMISVAVPHLALLARVALEILY
jgi:hypothetical protein